MFLRFAQSTTPRLAPLPLSIIRGATSIRAATALHRRLCRSPRPPPPDLSDLRHSGLDREPLADSEGEFPDAGQNQQHQQQHQEKTQHHPYLGLRQCSGTVFGRSGRDDPSESESRRGDDDDEEVTGGARADDTVWEWHAQRARARAGNETITVAQLAQDGSYELGTLMKRTFVRDFGLDVRDLARVGLRSAQPSFEPRRAREDRGNGFVLVGVGSFHAVIRRRKMAVVAAHGAHGVDTFVSDVSGYLRQATTCSMERPYELRAIEAFLSATMDRYTRRISLFRPLSQRMVSDLLRDQTVLNVRMLWRLLPLQNYLVSLQRHLAAMRGELARLIDDQRDLDLCVLHRGQGGTGRSTEAADPVLVEEVELIFEQAHRESASLEQELATIIESISAATQLADMTLDQQRNELMTFSLRTAIASACLTVSGVAVGLFGMNVPLPASIAEGAGAGIVPFAAILAAVTLAPPALYIAVRQLLAHRSAGKASLVLDATAMHAMYGKVDAVDAALRGRVGQRHFLTRDEVCQIIDTELGEHLSAEDLDLIFGILDANNDEVYTRQDAALRKRSYLEERG
jgi:Mg2+ and Co2+ transporter CorA